MANLKPDRPALRAQPEVGPVKGVRSIPPRRPFGVTLLLWLVLSLSAWGLLRLAGALRWWNVLYENDARLSPLFLSISGAAWAVIGIVLLWSIFWRQRWAYLAIPVVVLVWLAQYWIERALFEAPRSNLPFAVAASLGVLAITWFIAFRRSTKTYLTKSEEHE